MSTETRPAAELTPAQLDTLQFIGDGKHQDRLGGRGDTIRDLACAGLIDRNQLSDFTSYYLPTAAGRELVRSMKGTT